MTHIYIIRYHDSNWVAYFGSWARVKAEIKRYTDENFYPPEKIPSKLEGWGFHGNSVTIEKTDLQ